MARLDKLRARRTDPSIVTARGLNEVYTKLQEDEAVRYTIGAMQPIDPEYTKNTYAESQRVQNQLTGGYAAARRDVEYKHQGSVTSDTHIRAHSDIDLLVLETRFIYVAPPLQPKSPYQGNALQDLLGLRSGAENTLIAAYPTATVNCTGSKAISLSGGSLRRKIDVVVAGWLDTDAYENGFGDHHRGIRVLDKSVPTTIENKPFLHNFVIDRRDGEENGNLRKVIRLLKSLKYDADKEPSISSYDIAALCCAANKGYWTVSYQQDLQLVTQAKKWLDYLAANPDIAGTLNVPNGTRKIFCVEGATFAGLDELRAEVNGLHRDLMHGLARSFRKLEEARVAY